MEFNTSDPRIRHTLTTAKTTGTKSGFSFSAEGSKIFGLVMLLVCPRQCLLVILPPQLEWWVFCPLCPSTRPGRRWSPGPGP